MKSLSKICPEEYTYKNIILQIDPIHCVLHYELRHRSYNKPYPIQNTKNAQNNIELSNIL